MTTYRHPVLGRKTGKGTLSETGQQLYQVFDREFLVYTYNHTEQELLALGFEEVKEERKIITIAEWRKRILFPPPLIGEEEEKDQDRIDNLYKELSCDAELGHKEGNLFPRMTNDFFRQAIEKHMPKRLCRIIKRGDLQGKEFDYIIIDENVTEEQIKELQEEKKEERAGNWIDACVDEIFEYQRGRPKENEPYFVSVRKIIEKHLPKQKKVIEETMRLKEQIDAMR